MEFVAIDVETANADMSSICQVGLALYRKGQLVEEWKLRLPRCRWLDSARVARRTWADFAQRGYGLGTVCAFLGYDFTHHDALEDAKAAACILNAAMEKTGLDLEGWLRRIKQPIEP